MASAIYTLCGLTSLLCAALLFRGYLRSRARLLFWCSLCFTLLALHNALLTIDEVFYPDVDLRTLGIPWATLRLACSVVGLALLCWGLVWDSERATQRNGSAIRPSGGPPHD
jgi:hypothetical protein